MGRKIEWPPGSGRTVYYEDHELDLMRRLREQAERGEITRAELLAQVNTIHDAKIELDAVMVATDEELAEAQQQSFFHVPPRAQRILGKQAKPTGGEPNVDDPF